MLTIFGLVLQIGLVPLILTGHFKWAVLVGIFAGFCDALDGAVARAGVGPAKAGAFLDSTTDRISGAASSLRGLWSSTSRASTSGGRRSPSS